MIRILFYLLVVLALGFGFAWLADRPGEMVITFQGYQYTVSLLVAAVIVVAIVAAVMLAWWIVKGVWNSPYAISRYFRVRRRDRGYQALSSGMIAAGAGDAIEARRHKKQAMKLINADQEPLIHLLDAQASLLEGDHEAARAKFEAMLDDPEMRLLGLRGLYLEAQRAGDKHAAFHYAERAADSAPQLPWAATATLEARTGAHDWDGALRLIETRRSTRQIEKDVAGRQKAVLLTAKAMDLLESDPSGARNAAMEANRLAPDLVPAAVIAAKALFRQGEVKKGAKILEAAWKQTAHPEIADAYVQARLGDSTHDRLTRAKRLLSLRRNNAEAELAVAHAALAAGETIEARKRAEAAIRIAPTEGAYLLMADIEEAETGDQGRIRQWLARAVKAQPDPAWVADGVVAERWAPVSPVTGRLDAFEWRQPIERLGALIEQTTHEAPLLPVASSASTDEKPASPAGPVQTSPIEKPAEVSEAIVLPRQDQTVGKDEGKPFAVTPAASSATPGESIVAPVAKPPSASGEGEMPGNHAKASPSAGPVGEDRAKPAVPFVAPRENAGAVGIAGSARPAKASTHYKTAAVPAEAGFIVPDDPGVDPEERDSETAENRFRLF